MEPEGVTDILWRLERIQMPGGSTDVTPEDGKPSIRFGDEADASGGNVRRMTGRTGCNAFQGSYEIGGDGTLKIVSVHPTEIHCGERALQIEQAYLAALYEVAGWEVEGDLLRLRSADGKTVITFRESSQDQG
jgi:heat shock protein HslJ